MYNYALSFIAGLIAMAFVASSYFFGKKSLYLLFQSIGIVFLIISYFFLTEFFAMVGLIVGLARTLVYFFYANNDKPAPVFCAVTFCTLTVSVYLIVNIAILNDAKPVDLVNLAALCFYACVYLTQDLKKLRWLLFIPLILCVVYNLLISATAFVIISYCFEIFANILAILKSRFLHNSSQKQEVGQ